ncbi:hypothetical protein ebA1826 [Aromatoleum aromaticum EbN1]|uniref:Uncharacterized protein n=1 Tax=Aromatoleum aromaticum (strain DSM 19018 / LMG 30748 / EbN1) TaxID=76114 RepID=Q5P6E8_AROAE|nr:hypothetical protein ebA1826 [Aromatoleum aromaticum EbN1]
MTAFRTRDVVRPPRQLRQCGRQHVAGHDDIGAERRRGAGRHRVERRHDRNDARIQRDAAQQPDESCRFVHRDLPVEHRDVRPDAEIELQRPAFGVRPADEIKQRRVQQEVVEALAAALARGRQHDAQRPSGKGLLTAAVLEQRKHSGSSRK